MNENRFTVDECIEMCLECSESCLMTAAYCLGKGGEHAERQHITMIQLCAEACQLAAKGMILESPAAVDLCEVAARLCDRCEVDCLRYEDDEMVQCAEVCHQCAVVCRNMVSQTQQKLPAGVSRIGSVQNLRI